ncbi:MAG: hypothetical protein GY904_03090 [Planctomycetaceae bacterium]|nr:hypothetical protein [Planctomycetaceae bacterium]
MINEKDAEAWVYANELGNIFLNMGSSSDYSNADGSNEAGQEFLAWLEDHRKQQNEIQAQKDLAPPRAPRQIKAPQPEAEPAPKKPGFMMLKMGENGIMKYWVTPGEVPVLMEEAGESGSLDSSTSDNSGGGMSPTNSGADDFEFLNNELSPFFESNRSQSVRN